MDIYEDRINIVLASPAATLLGKVMRTVCYTNCSDVDKANLMQFYTGIPKELDDRTTVLAMLIFFDTMRGQQVPENAVKNLVLQLVTIMGPNPDETVLEKICSSFPTLCMNVVNEIQSSNLDASSSDQNITPTLNSTPFAEDEKTPTTTVPNPFADPSDDDNTTPTLANPFADSSEDEMTPTATPTAQTSQFTLSDGTFNTVTPENEGDQKVEADTGSDFFDSDSDTDSSEDSNFDSESLDQEEKEAEMERNEAQLASSFVEPTSTPTGESPFEAPAEKPIEESSDDDDSDDDSTEKPTEESEDDDDSDDDSTEKGSEESEDDEEEVTEGESSELNAATTFQQFVPAMKKALVVGAAFAIPLSVLLYNNASFMEMVSNNVGQQVDKVLPAVSNAISDTIEKAFTEGMASNVSTTVGADITAVATANATQNALAAVQSGAQVLLGAAGGILAGTSVSMALPSHALAATQMLPPTQTSTLLGDIVPTMTQPEVTSALFYPAVQNTFINLTSFDTGASMDGQKSMAFIATQNAAEIMPQPTITQPIDLVKDAAVVQGTAQAASILVADALQSPSLDMTTTAWTAMPATAEDSFGQGQQPSSYVETTSQGPNPFSMQPTSASSATLPFTVENAFGQETSDFAGPTQGPSELSASTTSWSAVPASSEQSFGQGTGQANSFMEATSQAASQDASAVFSMAPTTASSAIVPMSVEDSFGQEASEFTGSTEGPIQQVFASLMGMSKAGIESAEKLLQDIDLAGSRKAVYDDFVAKFVPYMTGSIYEMVEKNGSTFVTMAKDKIQSGPILFSFEDVMYRIQSMGNVRGVDASYLPLIILMLEAAGIAVELVRRRKSSELEVMIDGNKSRVELTPQKTITFVPLDVTSPKYQQASRKLQ
jgi:hypothetical protein